MYKEEIVGESCEARIMSNWTKNDIFAWHLIRRDVCPASYRRHSFSHLNRGMAKSIWGTYQPISVITCKIFSVGKEHGKLRIIC